MRLCLLVIGLSQLCAGHIVLTWPPAREYDLDFLDNQITKPPCGMPKGKNRNLSRLFIIFNTSLM